MTASEHRARARGALKGKWLTAVLAGLVAAVTGAISGSGADFELNVSETEQISLDSIPEGIQTLLVSVLGWAVVAGVVVAVVAAIVQLVVGGAVGIGYRRYLLKLIDGQDAEFNLLFSQFHRMGQAALLRLVRGAINWIPLAAAAAVVPLLSMEGMLLMACGAFILILVLLVAMEYINFGFGMCEFIMAEDESCGAMDALKQSWAMMNGRRWDLCFLELSFIGWSILTGFTFGIGGLFLTPYIQTSVASFYREMKPGQKQIEGCADYSGTNSDYL